MPLSSVVGAQSIIRPGVCTSSTRPASPYDGQVIYETDTDKSLVYNGTGWVFLSTSRANAGGLDLVKTQTIGSAVSTVTVSDAFSSTYDAYRVIVSNVVTSGSVGIRMTLGSTTTGYYYVSSAALFNGGTYSVQVGDQNAAFWLVGGNTGAGTSSTSLDVISPFLTSRTFYSGSYISAGGGAAGVVSGYLANTTSYTAFTLVPDSGTMTGGTIRVYGYVNS